jgi:hypothetical protein
MHSLLLDAMLALAADPPFLDVPSFQRMISVHYHFQLSAVLHLAITTKQSGPSLFERGLRGLLAEITRKGMTWYDHLCRRERLKNFFPCLVLSYPKRLWLFSSDSIKRLEECKRNWSVAV